MHGTIRTGQLTKRPIRRAVNKPKTVAPPEYDKARRYTGKVYRRLFGAEDKRLAEMLATVDGDV